MYYILLSKGGGIMSIESALKNLIIEKYGSILAFSRVCEVPNSTINSFLTRGIGTATLSNILKVCNTLHISADELSKGRIVSNFTIKDNKSIDIVDILADAKSQLLNNEALMFNGKPADEESIQSILSAMEVGIALANKKNKK